MFPAQTVLIDIARVVLFAVWRRHRLLGAAADRRPQLGRNDDVFATLILSLDCLAKNFFGHAAGIGFCCVEEVEARFIVMIKHGKGFFFRD